MRKRISVRIRKFFDRFRVRITTGIVLSLLLHALLLTLRLGLPGLGLPGLSLPFSEKLAQTPAIRATIALQSGSPPPAPPLPPPPPLANTAEPKPLETQSSEKPSTNLPNARVKRTPNKTAQKAPRNAKALESTPALARQERKRGSLPPEDQSAPSPASTQQPVVTAAGEHPDTFKVPPPQPDDFVRTVPKTDSTPMPPQPTPLPAPPAIAMQTPRQTIEQAQEPTPSVERPAETQSYEKPDEAKAKETAPPEETNDVSMESGEKKDGEEVSEQEKQRKQNEQEAAQRAADEETRKQEEQRKVEELARQEAAKKQAELATQQAAAEAARRQAEQKKEQEQQEALRVAKAAEARASAAAAEAARQEQVKKDAELAAQKQAELAAQKQVAEAARQEALRKQEDERKATELAAQKQAAEEQRQKALAAEQQRLAEQAAQAAREQAAAAERQHQEELAAQKRAQDLAAQQKAEADAAAQREAARAAAAAAAAERANAQANGSGAANQGNVAKGKGNGNGTGTGSGNGNGQGNGRGNGSQPGGGNTGSLASRALSQIGNLDLSPPPTGESDRPADDTRPRSIFGLYDHDVVVEAYINGWRTKIENNGDLNYSKRIAELTREDPVVTVWIRSDGSVKEIAIYPSSGRPEIDEAVNRIVRVRAPYSVFPPAMARKYDLIEIRRVWHFGETLRLLEEMH